MNRLNKIEFHLSDQKVSSTVTKKVSIKSKKNGVGIIEINNKPVNSLDDYVMNDLSICYETLIHDPNIKAIVITGHGKFFMAGADIPNLAKMQQKAIISNDKQALLDYIRIGHDLFKRIESGPKPVVAAVNGPALGGGCELAISCNARIALKTAKFALPELKLGLIPGLGGTQRFPRLIGLEKAVKYTLSGRSINAKDALKFGLVDVVVRKYPALIDQACEMALAIAMNKLPRKISLYATNKIGNIADGQLIIKAAHLKVSRKSPNINHPHAYLDAVSTGLISGGNAGIEEEILQFAKVAPSITGRSLVHVFLSSKLTSKIPNISAKQAKPIKVIGIIGAGTMGAGIAIAFLRKGYHIILKEINQKALEIGIKRIINLISRFIKKMKMNPMTLEYLMRNLSGQITYDHFNKCDLVIEAAVENIKIKQNIFATLEKICHKNCILATNTSTIDIKLVGKKMKAIDRLIGLHFFSPAHIMPLVEIIKTSDTSASTIATCVNISKSIGKTPVVVGNCIGFTANRAFFPYGQAASFLLECQINPYRIDKALERFGMPMGVFKMADLSGIDIFLHVGKIIASAYGERVYLSKVNQYMTKDNRLGQKTGKGFYIYKKNKPIADFKGIEPYIKRVLNESKHIINSSMIQAASKLNDDQIVQILLYTVVNESFRILDENMVYRESDIDIVSIMGYGFPAYRGGILFWARIEGLKKVYNTLQYYSNLFGVSQNNKQLTNFLNHVIDYVLKHKNLKINK